MEFIFVKCAKIVWNSLLASSYKKQIDMAEIEKTKPANKNKKKAFVKRNTRVDLTPMVDLGFLLITFFLFTTTLSLPTVMSLNMPFDKVPPGDPICQSCVLTILLAKDNVVKYYEGMAENNPEIKETTFDNNGIRNIIVQKRKAVQQLNPDCSYPDKRKRCC